MVMVWASDISLIIRSQAFGHNLVEFMSGAWGSNTPRAPNSSPPTSFLFTSSLLLCPFSSGWDPAHIYCVLSLVKHLGNSQRRAQLFVSYVIPKVDNENGQSQWLNKFVQTMQTAKRSRGSAPASALWKQATSVALLVHPNSYLLGLDKAKLKPPSRKGKAGRKKAFSSHGISLFNRQEASSQPNSRIPLPQVAQAQVFAPGLTLSSRNYYTSSVPKALRRTPSQWSDSPAHSMGRTLRTADIV